MSNDLYVVSVKDIHCKNYSFDFCDGDGVIASYHGKTRNGSFKNIRLLRTILVRNDDGSFVEQFSGLRVDVIGMDDVKYGNNVCDVYHVGEDVEGLDVVLFSTADKVHPYHKKRHSIQNMAEFADDVCDYLFAIFGIGMSRYSGVNEKMHKKLVKERLT